MPGSFNLDVMRFLVTGAHPADQDAITYFRTAFCCALLVKYIVERCRHYPWHVMPGSFVYETYIRNDRVRRVAFVLYRRTFNVRPIAIVLLALGVVPGISASVLAVSYVCEMLCVYRFHIMMMTIITGVIALDSSFGTPLVQATPPVQINVDSPGVIFIKTQIIVMYLASAMRKIQFKFQDGVVLREGARFSVEAKGRKHVDHPIKLTGQVVRWVTSRYSRHLSFLTIALQILIPIFLIMGGWYTIIGCILSFLLHLFITFLFPITLAAFTIMMWSSLILWLYT